MKIAIDSCSIILLSKATVLEAVCKEYDLIMAKTVYEEVLKGKDKKFMDALLTEKMVKEKKIIIKKVANARLVNKLIRDFNLGNGEAEALALAISGECECIITDNKQGRKSALIHGLKLIGSIDVISALCKLKLIDKSKAQNGLMKLKEFGWFQEYLIESAMEEIKNA
mgnify:CR=1 FL=1